PASFAATDVRAALERQGYQVAVIAPPALTANTTPLQVVLTTTESRVAEQPSAIGLEPQGYALRRTSGGTVTRWWAIGRDAPGAMYAGLELAEEIRLNGSLAQTVERQVN